MEYSLETDKKQISNRKSSARLLATIMLVAISGISFKIAINNTSNPEIQRSDKVEITTENTPTPYISPTPIPTRSIADTHLTGTGGELVESESNRISCGLIDVNRNEVVDVEELRVFQLKYMKLCVLEVVDLVDKCGMIDSNNNQLVDIFDFVNIINKFRASSCE